MSSMCIRSGLVGLLCLTTLLAGSISNMVSEIDVILGALRLNDWLAAGETAGNFGAQWASAHCGHEWGGRSR